MSEQQLKTIVKPSGFAGLWIRENLIWAQKANQQRVQQRYSMKYNLKFTMGYV